MKNMMALGFAAVVALGVSTASLPAHAVYDTAAKNERRAIGQEFKAERAAARGDGYKAEKHAENANRDFYKASKDAPRVIREEIRY